MATKSPVHMQVKHMDTCAGSPKGEGDVCKGMFLYFSMQQEELKVQPPVTFSLNFFKEGVWAQQDLQDSVCRD